MEGAVDNLLSTTYAVTFARHDSPDIAETGHYWEIVEFAKLGEVK